MSAPSLYTSAATSRALAEAGLPQEGGEAWVCMEHGLVKVPWFCAGAGVYRAWRLDELIALLSAAGSPPWLSPTEADQDCRAGLTAPHWNAAAGDHDCCGPSPVEAVAALVLAVRGAGKGEEPRT